MSTNRAHLQRLQLTSLLRVISLMFTNSVHRSLHNREYLSNSQFQRSFLLLITVINTERIQMTAPWEAIDRNNPQDLHKRYWIKVMSMAIRHTQDQQYTPDHHKKCWIKVVMRLTHKGSQDRDLNKKVWIKVMVRMTNNSSQDHQDLQAIWAILHPQVKMVEQGLQVLRSGINSSQ